MSNPIQRPNILPRISGFIFASAERLAFIARPHNAIVVGLSLWSLSFLLCAPSLNIATHNSSMSRLEEFANQCRNPLDHNLLERILAYRIVMPTLAYSLGLRGSAGFVLVWMAAIGATALIHTHLTRFMKPPLAVMLTASLAMTVPIQASSFYLGHVDAASTLLAVALLVSDAPIWWLLVPALSLLNDERGVIALPAILIIRMLTDGESSTPSKVFAEKLLPFGIGCTAGMAIRHLITNGQLGEPLKYPIYPPMGPFMYGTLRSTLVASISSYRALWLLLPIAALAGGARLRLYALAAAAYAAAILLSSTFNADIWRGMLPAFPIFIFLAIEMAKRNENLLAAFLPPIVALQIVTPCLSVIASKIIWMRPLPISLLELTLGHSIVAHR